MLLVERITRSETPRLPSSSCHSLNLKAREIIHIVELDTPLGSYHFRVREPITWCASGVPLPELLRAVGENVRQQRGRVAGAVPIHRLPADGRGVHARTLHAGK